MSQVLLNLHHMRMSELDRLAREQHSLVTTAQLRKLGLSRRQVGWRAGNGGLFRLRIGVYRLPGCSIGWDQTVMASVLAARAKAVASHDTAASLWGLRHSDRDSAGLHLTADRAVHLEGVTSHQGRITPAEITKCRGIPVTTPERTIMDLAGRLTVRELGECVDDAMRRGLVQLKTLRRLVEQAAASKHGRRLLSPLHQVLADRLPGYRPDDSDFEKRMNAEWDRIELPPAERQYSVRCGKKTYRLDRALPDTRIAVEWESLAFHGTRSGMDRDSDRRADLTAAGWVVLSFTWNSRPQRIARAVLRLWRDRSTAVAPA